MLPASAVPVKVGVLSLVTPSPDPPVSLAAVRAMEGAAGGVVSIVMFSALETAETLPKESVALAVILCGPSASVLTVIPEVM